MSEIRSPIIVTLAHVDHGKTTLLDYIRQSTVAEKEPGLITQSISSTFVPKEIIEERCRDLLQKFSIKVSIPGLLWIDTPGHEAFSTMRERGGRIADIAVLLIDINEGIMPQTIESIEILKRTKTPFIVAINKIDRIQGWISEDICFTKNFENQDIDVKGVFEEKFYKVISHLSDYGFNCDRFDRITNFREKIAAVPISAKTGEGVPELLALLTGLAQQFLKDRLTTTDQSKGVILEVKDVTGMGKTIDVIIYDGTVRKGDYLVIEKPLKITKIRALLLPQPLKDMRVEKKFQNIDECSAASGVKISAPDLDDVVSGSAIRTSSNKEEAEKFLEEFRKEIQQIEIQRDEEGLILKADTIGSLEALVNIFKNYPIKHATIGDINKEDILEAESNKNNMLKVVIGFSVGVSEDAEKLAKNDNVKILISDVIYRLIEDYEKWKDEEEERLLKEKIDILVRPGKFRIIPSLVFRASDPAIVGCEVIGGKIRPGYKLFIEKNGIKRVGEIKQIQSEGKDVVESKNGDKVAISIIGPTVGRQIKEGDILYVDVPSEDYKKLRKFEKFLTGTEIDCLEEIAEIKRKEDPRYGI